MRVTFAILLCLLVFVALSTTEANRIEGTGRRQSGNGFDAERRAIAEGPRRPSNNKGTQESADAERRILAAGPRQRTQVGSEEAANAEKGALAARGARPGRGAGQRRANSESDALEAKADKLGRRSRPELKKPVLTSRNIPSKSSESFGKSFRGNVNL